MASDSVPLKKSIKKNKSKKSKEDLEALGVKDDLAGMIVNAGQSINYREMVIIWLWFLLIHSEIFIEKILVIISGSVDENNNMTMMGTIYSSFIMIIGIIIIDMVYR